MVDSIATNRGILPRICYLVGLLATCFITGCQYSYEYEVRGVIRDFSENTPLAGVTVALQADSLFGNSSQCVTDANGAFVLRFSVSDGAFSQSSMPTWTLLMTSPGFADQVVDISPNKEPQRAKTVNLISVVAYVRPLQ